MPESEVPGFSRINAFSEHETPRKLTLSLNLNASQPSLCVGQQGDGVDNSSTTHHRPLSKDIEAVSQIVVQFENVFFEEVTHESRGTR